MKWPKISIVTPSFNQGKYIEETIESVLSQNYPNLEYWVIDAGSTDNTLKILKKYDRQLNWFSEPDKGQSDAINKGLKKSSGEILAYLNSDDIYLPGTLGNIAKYYRETKADWITGDYRIIDESGKLSKTSHIVTAYKRLLMAIYSPLILKITDSMFPQPSTFWSRRAYERVGEFNTKYHYVMDYDYWLRMSKHFEPHYLKTPLSGFRIHALSKSESSRKELMRESIKALRDSGASSFEVYLHKIHNWFTLITYKFLS